MIKFISVLQADFNTVSFNIIGDGVSTELSLNLNRPPFLINFQGAAPSAVHTTFGHETIVVATATISKVLTDDVMSLTFSEAPPDGVELNVNARFEYSGV
jgi:hypothetical protein